MWTAGSFIMQLFKKRNIIDAFWQTLYPMRFLSMPQKLGPFGDR
jgi:hypothetical protein